MLWDPEIQAAFEQLPGAAANELKLDPWIADQLDAFIALHEVEVAPTAADALAADRRAAPRRAAGGRGAHGRPRAEPIPEVAARLGGELAPFQWVAVRYALEARRTFLADEQGLGKTVEALAALEADGAFPAVVVCPASMKLTWEREAAHWLPHRSRRRAERPRPARRRRRHHDPQLRDRRGAPGGARAPRAAGAGGRRVALLQEPAGQAHPGGAPAGRRAFRPTGCGWR